MHPLKIAETSPSPLLTGANDRGFYRNKLTQRTKDAFDKLEKANPGNFIHRIELIPGMGHGIDYKLTTPWLKQYTRKSLSQACKLGEL